MSERFTETLRAVSEPGWSRAVGHRFVEELFAGAVLDRVWRAISSKTTASSTAS
jgi:thiaminase/transcriptional activator TenA